MKNKDIKHVYIIGIGGKGLNSIAEFCVSKGYKVSGSDIKESPETKSLLQKGVQIYFDQTGKHIDSSIDLVIHSSIIKQIHSEIKRARHLQILVLSRAEFLGKLTDSYQRISVAGSHGKSTTSALATLALKSETGEVNAITGAYIKELDSYQTSGHSHVCVLEACEYGKSFLHIPGDYTLITSLEKSHMEYFKTEEKMNEAFKEFISTHKSNAVFIINGDILKLKEICLMHPGKVITCGFNTANDYVIKNIKLQDNFSVFSIFKEEICIERDIQIKIPGTYNVLNVALVFALLYEKRVGTSQFRKILNTFSGVGRRFEIEHHKSTIFVDDFAHHPTQVKNLFKSLKQFFPDKKIYAIFEPRQYHLIKTFLKEYGKSFNLADEVCITDIVPALGDTRRDVESLSTSDIIDSVQKYSRPQKVWYAQSYQEIVEKLNVKDLTDTVIATIGAGSIFKVRDLLVNRVQ